ncbi:MAG: hypothetical protein AB1656_05745 [Candidatus Omnitrophota bacterium]
MMNDEKNLFLFSDFRAILYHGFHGFFWISQKHLGHTAIPCDNRVFLDSMELIGVFHPSLERLGYYQMPL